MIDQTVHYRNPLVQKYYFQIYTILKALDNRSLCHSTEFCFHLQYVSSFGEIV